MTSTKFHLSPSDLEALDTLAARRGIKGLRAPGARSATVRDLIREAMAEGCPPAPPQDCLRACLDCDRSYTGPLLCPNCGGAGEPVGDGRQGPPVY